MLPQHYQIWAVNHLGADIDASSNSANESLDVELRPWKFGTAGALEYKSTAITRALASDLADGAAAQLGADIDNSTDLMLGLAGRMELSSDDATHDGTVDIYVVGSYDGGTTFPSDHANFNVEEDGILIGSLIFNHDATGTDVKGTEILMQ